MKSRSAFALGALAASLALAFAQQSLAGAPSSSVDPARDRIGQIVYPLGVHPPKDAGKTQGISAKDKTAQTPNTGSRPQNAKDTGKNTSGQ
jgi:hypothetical protein